MAMAVNPPTPEPVRGNVPDGDETLLPVLRRTAAAGTTTAADPGVGVATAAAAGPGAPPGVPRFPAPGGVEVGGSTIDSGPLSGCSGLLGPLGLPG